MTEAEARAALRAFVGVGDMEPWIADQPWKDLDLISTGTSMPPAAVSPCVVSPTPAPGCRKR